MKFPVLYARIYALDKSPTSTTDHPLSPIQLADFPDSGLEAEIHLGLVPPVILEGLKASRAWSSGLLRGLRNLDELRSQAFAIPEDLILGDSQSEGWSPTEPRLYATLIIKDLIELEEDESQQLYGVTNESWASLDRSDFFGRHKKSLDLLSVRTSLAIEPYRYIWLAWDAPLVRLPTGIALRPPRSWFGRPRLLMPPIEQLDLTSLQSPAARGLGTVPIALHFYLRAATEMDRIDRFFMAFRALEVLCRQHRNYVRIARRNCANVGAGQVKAIGLLKGSGSIEKRFATLALALRPAHADIDLVKFSKLNSSRDDLAHGNRILEPEETPDDETFELLQKSLDALR
jgi:hypothetical protein